jgi:DNA repair protein RadC
MGARDNGDPRWHVLSRGTRTRTPVSIPEVFVPACLTPGTTGLMVVHNHPSGPTPSADHARLTLRLCAAAGVLDIAFVDHLIVGDEQRRAGREPQTEAKLE